MVVFSCDSCGDSLRKKDVQKHYQFKCRTCETLTCVDCKKQFWGDEYAAHTQCITDEDFKYGLSKEHKDDKGLTKQNVWRSSIDALLADRSTEKHWVPILLEMQKYENIPRKKKPFVNWCKCTMKRFPPKVVEQIFEKMLEVNAKRQAEASKQESSNGRSEEKSSPMEVDGSENDNVKANGDEQLGKKKKRKLKNTEEAGSDGEPSSKKEKITTDESTAKFRLKRCVAEILVEKDEPMKIKRILKKLAGAYFEHVEKSNPSGKRWTESELSAKLEKLVASNKTFKNCNGVVQLTEIGKKKYSGTVVDSD